MINIPKSLLSTTIMLSKKSGIDYEGQPTYEAAQTFKGRVETYNKQEWKIQGDLVNYNWVVYLNGDIDITNDSKAQIGSNEYIVKNIDKHMDPNGSVNHTKLYLI